MEADTEKDRLVFDVFTEYWRIYYGNPYNVDLHKIWESLREPYRFDFRFEVLDTRRKFNYLPPGELAKIINVREGIKAVLLGEYTKARMEREGRSGYKKPEAATRFSYYLNREEEIMAREIIKTGYKQLSLKYHPDKGGDAGKMILLNLVIKKLLLT